MERAAVWPQFDRVSTTKKGKNTAVMACTPLYSAVLSKSYLDDLCEWQLMSMISNYTLFTAASIFTHDKCKIIKRSFSIVQLIDF